jgi:hypothetical protein
VAEVPSEATRPPGENHCCRENKSHNKKQPKLDEVSIGHGLLLSRLFQPHFLHALPAPFPIHRRTLLPTSSELISFLKSAWWQASEQLYTGLLLAQTILQPGAVPMEEAEISGITVQSQLKANRFRDPISEKKKKKNHKKVLVGWLKVQTLSSSPRTSKK